ncbi:MAG: type II toxin-antitoxin system RelE/ParE family toxin [Nanoarchaeota archaeon]|nr:type II toxin-antitoxin system RelE/ParE family toxin [Nanoarchaeota archaeon]
MIYEITPSCKRSIIKHCRKNPVLEKAIKRKIQDIMENPYRFNPLRYGLAGVRRVHIMKSFVLMYEVDRDAVIFVSFTHHDEAYQR